MNLYDETENALKLNGYTWEDVVYIGSEELAISIENFIEVAKRTDYEDGYGAAKVAEDLMIIMNDDAWYDRGEYDGSEWWEYHTPIKVPVVPMVHTDRLIACGVGWESLQQIYEHKNEDLEQEWENLHKIITNEEEDEEIF